MGGGSEGSGGMGAAPGGTRCRRCGRRVVSSFHFYTATHIMCPCKIIDLFLISISYRVGFCHSTSVLTPSTLVEPVLCISGLEANILFLAWGTKTGIWWRAARGPLRPFSIIFRDGDGPIVILQYFLGSCGGCGRWWRR